MEIIDVIQGSPEWFKIRTGIPTSSNFDKIVTTKGVPSSQAKKYLYKLAGEFISGIPENTYQSAAMERGCILEPEARSLYEVVRNVEVTEVGFCISDTVNKFGASPDGLVEEDGLLEIKCPNLATHVGYLIENKLPSDYIQQVQGQLLVTKRRWCDFMSYYPGLRPLIVRVKKDDIFLTRMGSELHLFCERLQETINKIK